MGELSSWVQTVAYLVMGIFMIGVIWNTQREHGRRLDEHDELHEETQKHDTAQDVALAKLESFNQGYAAARALYERHEK